VGRRLCRSLRDDPQSGARSGRDRREEPRNQRRNARSRCATPVSSSPAHFFSVSQPTSADKSAFLARLGRDKRRRARDCGADGRLVLGQARRRAAEVAATTKDPGALAVKGFFNASASGVSASSHRSTSAGMVRITGIAFGRMGETMALTSITRNPKSSWAASIGALAMPWRPNFIGRGRLLPQRNRNSVSQCRGVDPVLQQKCIQRSLRSDPTQPRPAIGRGFLFAPQSSRAIGFQLVDHCTASCRRSGQLAELSVTSQLLRRSRAQHGGSTWI